MILATTMYDLWEKIVGMPQLKYVAAIIIIVFSIVEIAPIKVNPWSWLGALIGRWLGIKATNDKIDALEKKVYDRMDAFEVKVDELDHKVEENDIVSARVRILRFSSEIQGGLYHNKDSWDQTMMDVAKYEKYVAEHPNFKNGITEPTIEYIQQQYKERLERHDWEVKK